MKINIFLSKKRKNRNRQMPIYFRITHKQQRSEISSGIFIEQRYFSQSKKQVLPSHPLAETYNNQLIQIHAKLLEIVYNLKNADINEPSVVRDIYHGNKKIDVSHIVKSLPPFVEWSRKYIELKYKKKYNTRKIYTDAINYLTKFEEQRGLTIHHINKKMAAKIHDFFTLNDRLNYFGKLKFLAKEFNHQFDQENHLDKYKIPGKGKYSKNALSQEDMKRISEYEPKNHRSKIFHDIFLFQYYSAGSRFGDVLKLKWNDIKNGYIHRQEEKTEKERTIPLNNSSLYIIRKYQGNESEYVFDLDQPKSNISNETWSKYKSKVLASMNSYLKTMRETLGIKTHISSHTSRHTFASHSFEVTQDIKSTSLLIGHSMLATTEKYVHTDEKMNKKLFERVYEEK